MKVFKYLDRIRRMHRLLINRSTGTPEECAHQLGISRTTLYELIDELRSQGAQITYSKSSRTFYYREPFDIIILCSMKPLSLNETKEFQGGIIFLPESFFSVLWNTNFVL